IPADGSAYVAGRLEGDTIMRKKNVGGRLLIAREGLEALEKTTKTKAVAAAAAALVSLVGGSVMAAVAPPMDAPDETITLSTGFSPDPQTMTGTAGGFRDVSEIGAPADCVGQVSVGPNAVLNLTADFPSLTIMANSADDTTLVVQQPDGSFLCNDDFEGYNPAVQGAFSAGEYKVWVGTFSEDAHPRFTLGVTANAELQPSSLQ
ncbi:MAG: hypothetical protein AAF645_13735, partial [Myxococcota bacterium]